MEGKQFLKMQVNKNKPCVCVYLFRKKEVSVLQRCRLFK